MRKIIVALLLILSLSACSQTKREVNYFSDSLILVTKATNETKGFTVNYQFTVSDSGLLVKNITKKDEMLIRIVKGIEKKKYDDGTTMTILGAYLDNIPCIVTLLYDKNKQLDSIGIGDDSDIGVFIIKRNYTVPTTKNL